jgi:uncharacterized membrane protein
LAVLQRFARWQLKPILLVGLGNVLVCYYPEGCRFSWVWFVVLIAVAVLAGIFTPDGLLWFTALCMSIPALMARTRQHGALFDGLWLGFLHPILWVYFLEHFTPIYIAYVIFVRLGMIVHNAVVAFKEGYSGIDRYGQDAQPDLDTLNR